MHVNYTFINDNNYLWINYAADLSSRIIDTICPTLIIDILLRSSITENKSDRGWSYLCFCLFLSPGGAFPANVRQLWLWRHLRSRTSILLRYDWRHHGTCDNLLHYRPGVERILPAKVITENRSAAIINDQVIIIKVLIVGWLQMSHVFFTHNRPHITYNTTQINIPIAYFGITCYKTIIFQTKGVTRKTRDNAQTRVYSRGHVSIK